MIRENWNLNNYQMQARKFAIYPERMKITYPALGLAGEAGEVDTDNEVKICPVAVGLVSDETK